jgi:processing peptidase subunit beta
VGLQVLKQDVSWAVRTLSEMLLKPALNASTLETEKEKQIHLQGSLPAKEFTLENVLLTSFRDHMVGQPRLGNRRSVESITAEDIRQWNEQVFSGSNLVVVGTGEVDHEELVSEVEA